MKMFRRGVAAALLSWLVMAGAQTPSSTQRITMNFQNVDIAVLAEQVGRVANLTFILDPRVRAPPVNMINAKPMTPSEIYQAFLQILAVNQFATSRTGNIIKIVPEQNIVRMPGVDLPDRVNGSSDEHVTTMIELKNISAQQLNQLLRQLMPATGSFSQAMQGTNALVIVDRASNVVRLQKIAQQLDEAGGSGIDMIELQNSSASEVARTLTTLLAATPAEAAAGGAPKVVADDRTNSILISGDAAARQRVATQIANLDKPVADDDNIETRYLKWARAETVATTLNGQKSAVVASTSGNAGAAAVPAAGGASAASSANADRNVTIQFDAPTNMLIITAPPKIRRALWKIVEQMDIPRAQVYIEAIIADVGMDNAGDLGVNWAVFSQENGKVVPGALFNAAVGTATGSPIDLAGVANLIDDPESATSVPQGSIFGLGKLKDNGVSWAAMLRALSTNSTTNVIANPTQLTLDNQEVTLTSGQEVPFTTGTYTNNGNNVGGGNNPNPFTTVQRQKVGTTLKITPQLNGSDAMTLTIDLESSELAGQVGDANSQITNTRTFHNVVIVKDQQWIVVGGLVRDSKTGGESRVPLLSRIPILGYLFRTKSEKRTKSNLMVFIKPTIILDSLGATNVANAKYREYLELLDTQEAHDKGEKLPPPRMPALDQPAPARAPQTSPVP